MPTNRQAGDIGELEVIKLVACPNCGKELMKLPSNYPLYDVQCVGCSFRAQVKTSLSKPKSVIFGAGWEIIDKVLKSGFITPPLFANFKWTEGSQNKQMIKFYPFISKKNLRKRFTTIKKSQRQLWMFDYIDLDKLPSLTVYEK